MKISFILLISALIFVSCAKNEDEMAPPVNPPGGNTVTEPFTVLKSGNFKGQNGYPASGTAELGKDSAGTFFTRLKSDFSTTFATGSVTLYLSKSQNLSLNQPGSFIQLGVINTNGVHDFKLLTEPTSDFNFVIVWCAPASIQFGYAILN